VFGAGDCVTLESYADKNFPPKAGVYAVREGPIMAQNILNYLTKQPLATYTPQSGFLALLMTGDEKAVGGKFGIAFSGKWVWNMKDYIDKSFMKLFDPYYLFRDYDTKQYEAPDEKGE
jgi:selenide,water dikinase